MAGKIPFFLINGGRPGFVVLEPTNNPDYKKLKEQEANRTLKSPYPNVVPRAAVYATKDMLYTEEYDEINGVTVDKFRDEVVLAVADAQGRFWVEADKPELARRILRDLRKLDPSVKLDEGGQVLPEESPDFGMEKNRGGRPKKASK